MFTFCLSHFSNHALGIISVEAMSVGSDYHYWFWHNSLGISVLAVAALTHVSLALWRTSKRRTLIMPAWEFWQLVLGLYIPWTLAPHVVATLGLDEVYDLAPTYQRMLSQLWPSGALMQSILLVVVWTHAMIGLHFWLRLYPLYRRLRVAALSFAVVFPILALWGWIEGARRHALDTAYKLPVNGQQIVWLYDTADQIRAVIYAFVILSLSVIFVRFAIRKLQQRIRITYPGDISIRTTPGPSLLEISRINNIPHAAVCGGRARCSTCRVLVLAGGEALADAGSAERAVLARIGADEKIRLACQIRPVADLSIQPLVPARATEVGHKAAADAYYWGIEQQVAIMFVDLRNFTGITEKNLSYDVVFLLNRYLDSVSVAIRAENGHVDKFIGDGIMAIFGMQTSLAEGCRQAIRACKRIREVQDQLNADRGPQYPAPLRLGIGLHAGPAILGRIGAAGSSGAPASITALGDVVNTASRLETENKTHGSFVTISADVLVAAGIDLPETNASEITLRGKAKPLKFYSLQEIEGLNVPA